MAVSQEQIKAALRVLARVDRTDMLRLIETERYPVIVRRRDSVRNMIGLVLDHVGGRTITMFNDEGA